MGCDIHLYQEKRVNGKWVAADAWEPGTYDDEKDRMVLPYQKRLYSQRNYRLFGVLANVRNGIGFAGIRTGDAVTPIAPPRGLPGDACDEVAHRGEDGHSHSWLTLADLLGYGWPNAKKRGVVDIATYRAWQRSGEPNPKTWSGSVSGPGIQIITQTEADALDQGFDNDRIYVDCEWTTSLRDDCAAFLEVVIPRLRELEAECGDGNARLVFFFDN